MTAAHPARWLLSESFLLDPVPVEEEWCPCGPETLHQRGRSGPASERGGNSSGKRDGPLRWWGPGRKALSGIGASALLWPLSAVNRKENLGSHTLLLGDTQGTSKTNKKTYLLKFPTFLLGFYDIL